MISFRSYSLRKMCKYSEFLWYVFSRIWTEYRDLLWRSPYSVRMRGNTDQKNSKYGHFSRSDWQLHDAREELKHSKKQQRPYGRYVKRGYPVNIYLFKSNNKNISERCEKC